MRHRLSKLSCLLLPLWLGCAAPRASELGQLTDRSAPSSPATDPLIGPDDAAYAELPLVLLPREHVGRMPGRLEPSGLALATLVDGRLLAGSPEAKASFTSAWERSIALAEVQAADFDGRGRPSANDLCLAARWKEADILVICAVSSRLPIFRLLVFAVASAELVGDVIGFDPLVFCVGRRGTPAGCSWPAAALELTSSFVR